MFSNMSSSEEQNTPEEVSSPYCEDAFGLGSLFHDTKSKKGIGGSDRFIDKELFVDERKPSSMMVPDAMLTLKLLLNNDEHALIPVTAKIIHSAVCICNRFILKDGRPLHMVKLVGAVRNYHEKMKNNTINVENGPGLVCK